MSTLIKSFLDKSTVCDGIGFFAGEDIRKGEAVCDFDNYTYKIFHEEEWVKMKKIVSPHSFNIINKRTTKALDGLYYFCLDDSAFANHSENPNVIVHPGNIYISYACRDIRKGEEILYDYRTFYDPEYLKEIMGW